MNKIVEVPVTPDEVEAILSEAAIQSVTAWQVLNQVQRIEFMDGRGRQYRIDVGSFVELKEAE